jgi:hypothetical protein
VVAADTNLPIVNPLSGMQYGHLKVVLALGSKDQVTALQLMMKGVTSAPERPVTYLERCDMEMVLFFYSYNFYCSILLEVIGSIFSLGLFYSVFVSNCRVNMHVISSMKV